MSTHPRNTSNLQDKANVASGLHGSAGNAGNGAVAAGNDRAEHSFAEALDHGSIKAYDGIARLDLLAFDGEVLEALAVQLDGVESEMDDQFHAVAGRDTEGVSSGEELDECAGHRGYGYVP